MPLDRPSCLSRPLDVDWLGPLRSSFDELYQVAGSPVERDTGHETSSFESKALTELVLRLQHDGHTVLLLGAAGPWLVRPSADVGVGVGTRPVWSSDVIVPGLGAAWRLVNAVPASRTVNKRAIELSVGGTLLESLLMLAPRPRRIPGPVVTAGAFGLVLGWRAANEVMTRAVPEVAAPFPWHAMTVEQVRGLLPPRYDRHVNDAEPTHTADARVGRIGSAADLARRVTSVVREDLDDPMSPVLATGAAASAILGAPGDAALVSSVMIGNAVLSGVQRLRAEALLTQLLAGSEVSARVVIEGSTGRRSPRRWPVIR